MDAAKTLFWFVLGLFVASWFCAFYGWPRPSDALLGAGAVIGALGMAGLFVQWKEDT